MTVQQRVAMAIIVALASEKGGVGKTTLTGLFLIMLSMLGYRVLGIDMDPQGHLGLIYAYHRDTIPEGIYDILLKYSPNVLREKAPIRRIIKKTYYDSSGKVFDPRKPNNDSLAIVLRKVHTRDQIELIVKEKTQENLQDLFSFEIQVQDTERKEEENIQTPWDIIQQSISEAIASAQDQGEDLSKYSVSTIWYTIQEYINEASALAQEQGTEGDDLKEHLNKLLLDATRGRYTLETWKSTQLSIDEAVWMILQERLSTATQGPDILPINASAGEADHALKNKHQYWGEQLKQAISPLLDQYDYIFIDCPPSIQVLTINALNASDFVGIPLTPETLNMEGMIGLLGVIDQAQARANPTLKVAGLILNKIQGTWKIHQQGARDVRAWKNAGRVFTTEIKQNAPVVTSLDNQSFIVLDQGESEYAKAYWLLLSELLSVIGGPAVSQVSEIAADVEQQERERKKATEMKKQQRRVRKDTATSPTKVV